MQRINLFLKAIASVLVSISMLTIPLIADSRPAVGGGNRGAAVQRIHHVNQGQHHVGSGVQHFNQGQHHVGSGVQHFNEGERHINQGERHINQGGRYYHNGRYYNYYHNGTYWLYFVGGAYYNYYYNGYYYKSCVTVPADSVTTSGTRINATTVCY